MKGKSQLGKGMAALLGGGNSPLIPNPTENNQPEKKNTGFNMPTLVNVSQITPNKEQPRKIFKDKELKELSDSIKENGIIQPLIVAEQDGKLLLIAGERRLRAAKLAGLKQVPIVVKKVTKKETLVMAIIENVQRSDLNCVEEALSYYQLMSEFELTQEEVAKKIGKERSTIANFLRILKLPREVIGMVQKEQLSFGHAKVLVSVKDDERVKRLANDVLADNLSVRELEQLIKSGNKKKKPIVEKNKYFDSRLDSLKNKLEKKTGFQFAVNSSDKGAGSINIKFSNEAEFNDIYEYLMTK